MQCIWEGSLYNVLDNIKLCVIIENLHFWAMNHLRPWLSSCIDQWKRSIDEFEAENNRHKPERSSEKQRVKPNQSKARVPLFGANQSKPRSPLIDENTSNQAKTRNPSEGLASLIADLLEQTRNLSGGQTVLKGRSKQLDTHGRSNFALRRANTLESCLEQDEGHASSDDTSKSSAEEEEEDGGEEESEEEQDDYDDDHEPGSDEEDDEEREENMDMALEQLKISLRHDRPGRNALDVLLGYWSQYED